MYEYAVDFLEGRGFKHYEVSNFAGTVISADIISVIGKMSLISA